ncbi:hypothetical protein A3H22_01020 [Candidatus Peribacteria bacterium RIFCSPLOWO2_12_FULL_55_15]|nr:MAG: hypothetical protein A2789_00535 [Candidatus Peribacteria bacterium RIFCSPHIGHO2_01_FULL_54_22]OGJ63547.1 MAG: hypothetical protein A3D12_03810 [Candidatus Peribacteria bacterium RIFCSPHIGHO2_02_FULL_55_24]OGJ67663.1 MAG: hypothetical protein A2947_00710 [Candidatus Peribacteria bacterium RIFCSPLOWO2_01_FULL_54_110]OGJ70226.1 MAG: hypothetical protein A3H22_01020 [Candidatus Peribacteria bacterium RIFCSPLOWO2_12_FULL_55_15]
MPMQNILFSLVVITGTALALCIVGWFLRLFSDRRREENLVFFQMVLPKKESREEKEVGTEQYGKDVKEVIGVMDHLFQSIHGLYNGTIKRFVSGQPFFSFEYAALGGEILFFCVCPRNIAQFLEKQITSFYPDAILDEVEDYNIFTEQSVMTARTLLASKGYVSVFKMYQQLKSDSLNTITNAFSKLSKEEGAAIQIVMRPVKQGWQRKLHKRASELLNPIKKGTSILNPLTWGVVIIDLFTTKKDGELTKEDQPTHERVSTMAEEYTKLLEEKAASPGFFSCIRVVASANTAIRAQSILDTVAASFNQFNDTRGNSFTRSALERKRATLHRFIRRSPRRTLREFVRGKRLLLGTDELASFFHLPDIRFSRVATIKWYNFKIAPAPQNLPEDGVLLGSNTYRGEKRKVYMAHEDRFRHFYIIGQTGTGKSSMIVNIARQDFHNGHGVCVIDPHGELVESLLSFIPRNRADDVIYFNPSDTERPMGLNLLEAKTDEERDLIALDAMNMMVKMFGEEIFGPRIQDYFRNGCLTLMSDDEDGGAITDLVRLFTDDEWQRYKVSKVKNPIVRSFWEKQMAATGQREKQEMIPYFAAKFGQFYTNTLIRNIVGQTKSAFDVSECMNTGKILMMNLSKGLVGDINSQLIGMIIVSKIQVAAMRRQRQNKEERRDYFLYIDEFQNFVTPSIESILSEARKYRLGLILAHQYIDQLEKNSKLAGATSLKGAVFGNIGTMMFYKIGAQDAELGAKEMAPVFNEQDLVNMDAFKGALKLCIGGQPSRPFTLEAIRPWLDKTYPKDEQAAEAYRQLSRLKYGRQKDFVNREILRRIGV